MPFYSVLKKVHWSDADPAGIAWFPNYFKWLEDAEEELFVAALGRSRQAVLDESGVGLPRVDASIRYESPVRIGTLLRVAVDVGIEHPRRMRYLFEMWDTAAERRVAHGTVRVACVTLATFRPREFPADVLTFAQRIQAMALDQVERGAPMPWA